MMENFQGKIHKITSMNNNKKANRKRIGDDAKHALEKTQQVVAGWMNNDLQSRGIRDGI